MSDLDELRKRLKNAERRGDASEPARRRIKADIRSALRRLGRARVTPSRSVRDGAEAGGKQAASPIVYRRDVPRLQRRPPDEPCQDGAEALAAATGGTVVEALPGERALVVTYPLRHV